MRRLTMTLSATPSSQRLPVEKAALGLKIKDNSYVWN
jgi:hypothetical protein